MECWYPALYFLQSLGHLWEKIESFSKIHNKPSSKYSSPLNSEPRSSEQKWILPWLQTACITSTHLFQLNNFQTSSVQVYKFTKSTWFILENLQKHVLMSEHFWIQFFDAIKNTCYMSEHFWIHFFFFDKNNKYSDVLKHSENFERTWILLLTIFVIIFNSALTLWKYNFLHIYFNQWIWDILLINIFFIKLYYCSTPLNFSFSLWTLKVFTKFESSCTNVKKSAPSPLIWMTKVGSKIASLFQDQLTFSGLSIHESFEKSFYHFK